MVANICQIVDLLPHERYDDVQAAVDQFKLMVDSLEDHNKCGEKCKWPRYHEDLVELQTSKSYQNVTLEKPYPTKQRQTRLTTQTAETRIARDVFDDVSVRLKTLVQRLLKELKCKVFDEKTIQMIELTRKVTDIASLAIDVNKYGHVSVGLQKSQDFIKAVRKITSTLNNIDDDQLDRAFSRFLKKLEETTSKETQCDSKKLIKRFLSESALYTDIEVILHCICSAAVKVSVESNVESLVSRFKNHFGKNRQLSEEHALEEMLIAENGPILVHADSIIRKSLNSYFREHNPTDAGKWHFIKVRSRIQENTNKSLVMERMMAEKSKLSFMDNE